MHHIISRSPGRKAAALIIAVAGFVLLFETRMLDSAWEAMVRDGGTPAAGERLAFNATAYCKGTTTASGVGVRTGIAAADPTLLPVGTVLNIATGDLKYNGVYTVMDTGPKVQGRILDLYMWSCHEALRFGRKQVDITVLRLGWDPRASAPGLIDRLFRRREATRRVPPPDPPPPAGVAPEELSSDAPISLPADAPTEGATPTGSPEADTPGSSDLPQGN